MLRAQRLRDSLFLNRVLFVYYILLTIKLQCCRAQSRRLENDTSTARYAEKTEYVEAGLTLLRGIVVKRRIGL